MRTPKSRPFFPHERTRGTCERTDEPRSLFVFRLGTGGPKPSRNPDTAEVCRASTECATRQRTYGGRSRDGDRRRKGGKATVTCPGKLQYSLG